MLEDCWDELVLAEEIVSVEELALTEDESGGEEVATVVTVEELISAEDESDAEEVTTVVTVEELISAEDESDAEESRMELDESPVDVKLSVDVCKTLEVLGTLII